VSRAPRTSCQESVYPSHRIVVIASYFMAPIGSLTPSSPYRGRNSNIQDSAMWIVTLSRRHIFTPSIFTLPSILITSNDILCQRYIAYKVLEPFKVADTI
jgi:hypothetical protein